MKNWSCYQVKKCSISYSMDPTVCLSPHIGSLLSQWLFNTDTSLTVSITFYQVFEELVELITSSGNYSRYRQRFSECTGFRFPILGVHLKDLIAVHVALPDWTDTEKTQVNLTKTQQLYAILQELALIQAMTPKINANPDLLNLLIVSLGLKVWASSVLT